MSDKVLGIISGALKAAEQDVDQTYDGLARAVALALSAAGYAVVPREVIVQAWDAITELCDKRNLMTDENAELLNSLAAALAGRKDEAV